MYAFKTTYELESREKFTDNTFEGQIAGYHGRCHLGFGEWNFINKTSFSNKIQIGLNSIVNIILLERCYAVKFQSDYIQLNLTLFHIWDIFDFLLVLHLSSEDIQIVRLLHRMLIQCTYIQQIKHNVYHSKRENIVVSITTNIIISEQFYKSYGRVD